MAHQLRVTLVTGKVHRVPLQDESSASAIMNRIERDEAPFALDWFRCADGELIHKHAIASLVVEPASD
jgi:hypothetical protein